MRRGAATRMPLAPLTKWAEIRQRSLQLCANLAKHLTLSSVAAGECIIVRSGSRRDEFGRAARWPPGSKQAVREDKQ
jgi:hypothetical protein